MSTQFFQRPAAAYTGETGLPNRTKYNDDSTASPRRPISSTKVDGDINYLIDAVNALYDTAVTGVVGDNSITNAKLRDSAGCSVIGRGANTLGNPADIVASANDLVLVRKSNTLAFGTVPSAGIEDGAVTAVKIADTNVTFGKIQNVNTATLVGRSSSGAGSVEQLTLGTGLSFTGSVLNGLELATSGETQTGTNTTKAVTPAGLAASSLGMGQTWQNVTGSRALATTYTNSTGRPIQVSAHGTPTANPSTFTLTVAGVVVCSNQINTVNATGCFLPVSAIVPNGATYSINGTSCGLTQWNELR